MDLVRLPGGGSCCEGESKDISGHSQESRISCEKLAQAAFPMLGLLCLSCTYEIKLVKWVVCKYMILVLLITSARTYLIIPFFFHLYPVHYLCKIFLN